MPTFTNLSAVPKQANHAEGWRRKSIVAAEQRGLEQGRDDFHVVPYFNLGRRGSRPYQVGCYEKGFNEHQLRKAVQPPGDSAVAANPGLDQVANSGGGYSWQVDDWTRFDRFLILGAEGET